MRVLVTGASGLLGRAILAALRANSIFTPLGLSYSRERPGLTQCNLLEEAAVKRVFDDFKPDVVIHCAVERRPEVTEKNPELMKAVNVEATERLCRLAEAAGARMILISTDYVFDGKNPPYAVDAEPNPLNPYGVSKMQAERAAMTFKNTTVFRVSVLYGQVERLEESPVTILFRKVLEKSQPVVLDHFERRYPTNCADIAQVMVKYLQLPTDKLCHRIVQWTSSTMMTKYDMAVAMGEAMGLSTDHIKPDTNPPPSDFRPYDPHIDRSLLEGWGCSSERPFREAMAEYLKPFVNS